MRNKDLYCRIVSYRISLGDNGYAGASAFVRDESAASDVNDTFTQVIELSGLSS